MGKTGRCKVGVFPPNAWGLYDMHGLVWEWCLDAYYPTRYAQLKASLSTGRVIVDPVAMDAGRPEHRVIRGGCWYDTPHECRSSHRQGCRSTDSNRRQGMRLVMMQGEPR
jgi:formylglycine-generating enzyme required for sulfatase activity